MLKVIIVDDEVRIIKLIKALINWEKLNMEVIATAKNGIEAIECINKYIPDIIITDIQMPGIDGLELIRQAKIINEAMQIIIVSGHAQFSYAQTAMKYGVSDYLLKPINKINLEETLIAIADKVNDESEIINKLTTYEQQIQVDTKKIRNSFMKDLYYNKIESINVKKIKNDYKFQSENDKFLLFEYKLDFDYKDYNENSIKILQENLKIILLDTLKNIYVDIEIFQKNDIGIVICGLKKNIKSDYIKQQLETSVHRFIWKKEIFNNIAITIGFSKSIIRPKEICYEYILSKKAIEQRIIEGVNKVIKISGNNFEKFVIPTQILKEFNVAFDIAFDTKKNEKINEVILSLENNIKKYNKFKGFEIIKIIEKCKEYIIYKFKSYIDINIEKSEIESENIKTTFYLENKFNKEIKMCNNFELLIERLKILIIEVLEQIELIENLKESRPIRLAKSYIEHHFMEAIKQEDIAKIVGFNSSYFSSLFKKECKIGFLEYLTMVRVENAKKMLISTDDTIANICQKVGYLDVKYFTKTFKKITGTKPSEYRKLFG